MKTLEFYMVRSPITTDCIIDEDSESITVTRVKGKYFWLVWIENEFSSIPSDLIISNN